MKQMLGRFTSSTATLPEHDPRGANLEVRNISLGYGSSVVVRDVPAGASVFGNPAKVVFQR